MVGAKQKLGVGWSLCAKLRLRSSPASDVIPAAPDNPMCISCSYLRFSHMRYTALQAHKVLHQQDTSESGRCLIQV